MILVSLKCRCLLTSLERVMFRDFLVWLSFCLRQVNHWLHRVGWKTQNSMEPSFYEISDELGWGCNGKIFIDGCEVMGKRKRIIWRAHKMNEVLTFVSSWCASGLIDATLGRMSNPNLIGENKLAFGPARKLKLGLLGWSC